MVDGVFDLSNQNENRTVANFSDSSMFMPSLMDTNIFQQLFVLFESGVDHACQRHALTAIANWANNGFSFPYSSPLPLILSFLFCRVADQRDHEMYGKKKSLCNPKQMLFGSKSFESAQGN